MLQRSRVGTGYRPKFGVSDLAELRGRTGMDNLQRFEALGTLKNLRLQRGLLQRLGCLKVRLFHGTATSPHLGRDRAMQAILDAVCDS